MIEQHRRMGPITLALAIAAGLVAGGIILSVALWLLGLLAGIVFFILKVGVLIALAAAVIWGLRFLMGDRQRY